MFTPRTAGAFIAFAVVLASMTGMACAGRAAAAVAAEAVGYIAENAFFSGDLGDQSRRLDRNLKKKGGSRQGNEQGLYGGSKVVDVCDPEALLEFLLDAGNGKKKKAWAKALDISATNKNVRKYVKSLTPFVLGNDTLVANHGYKKGKADRYDAVLEAGTAVLVDVFGVPRVKCNCGNPLSISEYAPDEIEIEFKDKNKGNKKWNVKEDQVVRVEKADEPQEKLTVADVDDLAEEVEIPLPEEPELTGGGDSSNGESQTPAEVTIPDTRGRPVEDVTQELEDQGLVVEPQAVEDSEVGPGQVVGTDPPSGTTVAEGATVILQYVEASTTEPVPVPDVRSLTQEAAEAEISAAGLVPETQTQVVSSTEQVGTVIEQTPAAFSQVEPNSTVTLVIGQAPEAGEDVGGTGEQTDNGGTGTDAGTDAGLFGGAG